MTEPFDAMSFPAIDVHGHIGRIPGADNLGARLGQASIEEILARAESVQIRLTCVSPLDAFSPDGTPTDVLAANRAACDAAASHDRLRFYAVLEPKNEACWKQVEELLKNERCVGVKLHARWNHWDVDECGDSVFAFLSENDAPALAHTGNPGTEPERFIRFADRYPNVRLILAHLGHDMVDDTRDRQIKAVKMATQENVWVDTSSAKSITSGLLEYAVAEIGADRIVFGTDAPLYFAPMQKARIAYAGISDQSKRLILRDNAAKLFGLQL